MESTLKISTATSKRPSKRLLFDRRYGLVFDEWKDPSDEALAGGRGMFCVVPLAKGFLKMASQLIDLGTSSTIKVLERPDLLSPPILQDGLNRQLHKFLSGIQKPEFNLFAVKGISPIDDPTRGSSSLLSESSESQNGHSTDI